MRYGLKFLTAAVDAILCINKRGIDCYLSSCWRKRFKINPNIKITQLRLGYSLEAKTGLSSRSIMVLVE